jgi:hypothetical protein
MDRSEIGQFFKDTFKKEDSITPVKSGEIITFMFARIDEKERIKLMNFIDQFIIEEFKIKASNLPWLNTSNRDNQEDWTNFFVYFSLKIARILEQMTFNKRGQKLN